MDYTPIQKRAIFWLLVLTVPLVFLLLYGCDAIGSEVSRLALRQNALNETMAVTYTTEPTFTTVTLPELQKFWKAWIKNTPDRTHWKCVMYSSRFWCDWVQAHPHTAVFQAIFRTWTPTEGHACIVFYDGVKLRYFEPQTGQELKLSLALEDQLALVKG